MLDGPPRSHDTPSLSPAQRRQLGPRASPLHRSPLWAWLLSQWRSVCPPGLLLGPLCRARLLLLLLPLLARHQHSGHLLLPHPPHSAQGRGGDGELFIFSSYCQRGLLKRAENPPDSKSPIEFDAYSLNHAAFVGLNEVAWTTEFEQELTRRRVFVNKVRR